MDFSICVLLKSYVTSDNDLLLITTGKRKESKDEFVKLASGFDYDVGFDSAHLGMEADGTSLRAAFSTFYGRHAVLVPSLFFMRLGE